MQCLDRDFLLRRRGLKIIVELFSIVFAGILVLAALFAWRLSTGPVNIGFFTYKLEEMLSSQVDGRTAKIGETVIAWEQEQDMLVIESRDIKLFANDAPEEPTVSFNRVSFNLSLSDLLVGDIKPVDIYFYQPSIKIQRNLNNRLSLGIFSKVNKEKNSLEEVKNISQQSFDSGPFEKLETVKIFDAHLSIEDQIMEHVWNIPNLDILFKFELGLLKGRASFEADIMSKASQFDVEMALNIYESSGLVKLTFSELNVAGVAGLGQRFAALDDFDMPLSGVIGLQFADWQIQPKIDFDVFSAGGVLAPPLPNFQPVAYDGGEFSGYYNLAERRLDIQKFSLSLAKFKDQAEGDEPTTLQGQLMVTLAGKYPDVESAVKVSAMAFNVPLKHLGQLWPESIGVKPRAWVVPNIIDGHVANASLELEGIAKQDKILEFQLDKLVGDLAFEDATVHYFRPMTVAKNVAGRARFTPEVFDIDLTNVEVNDLRLKSGKAYLYGLDEDDRLKQKIKLDLVVNGPAKGVLQLANEEPLQYLDKIAFSAEGVEGKSTTNLELEFPLLSDLKLEQIDVSAKSKIEDFVVPDVVKDLDVRDGVFDLSVTEDSMELIGNAKLGQSNKYISWRENFDDSKALSSVYTIKGYVSALELEKFVPAIAENLSGAVNLDLTQQNARKTENGRKKSTLLVDADLSRAALKIEELGWEKPLGVAGELKVVLDLLDSNPSQLRNFSLIANDLRTNGSGSFRGAGKLKDLSIAQLVMPRTDLSAHLSEKGDQSGFTLDIKGTQLNAASLLESGVDEGSIEKKDASPGRPIDLNLVVNKVYLGGADTAVDQVTAKAVYDGEVWQQANAVGQIEKTPISFTIVPDGRKRRLELKASDAGHFLRAVDIADAAYGGDMSIVGEVDDAAEPKTTLLTVGINNFRLKKAPVLTQILSLASLSGIVDVLSGEGIVFKRLDAKIAEKGGVAQVEGLKAFGDSLGVELKGTVDLNQDMLDLKGTVIPAYAVNDTLSDIPIIGKILTGTSGDGIFAGKFSVTGEVDNAKVTVNPITSIAPGIVRDFLEVLSGGEN